MLWICIQNVKTGDCTKFSYMSPAVFTNMYCMYVTHPNTSPENTDANKRNVVLAESNSTLVLFWLKIHGVNIMSKTCRYDHVPLVVATVLNSLAHSR